MGHVDIMARFAYSIQGLDPDKTVKASIREADISFKHTREIAINIKGMLLERAKLYLEEVIAMKRSVPFKRYNKKIGHRSDLKGWDTGRYPVKAAREILTSEKTFVAPSEGSLVTSSFSYFTSVFHCRSSCFFRFVVLDA